MKIHPVGAELFHADGRTDMKKLIFDCRKPKNQKTLLWITFTRSRCPVLEKHAIVLTAIKSRKLKYINRRSGVDREDISVTTVPS
jgi:hypothetical protein